MYLYVYWLKGQYELQISRDDFHLNNFSTD